MHDNVIGEDDGGRRDHRCFQPGRIVREEGVDAKFYIVASSISDPTTSYIKMGDFFEVFCRESSC